MSPLLAAAARATSTGPPLDPTPDDARGALRGELLRPDYQRGLFERLLDWIARQLDGAQQSVASSGPLTTFAALLVTLLLAVAVGLLLSRARRTARSRRADEAVLADVATSAAELRAAAQQAVVAEQWGEALVLGFRAMTLEQVERGRLADQPGATAAEVARALAAEHPEGPHLAERLREAAARFDAVRYGDRPATAEQAGAVLALDADLRGRRTRVGAP